MIQPLRRRHRRLIAFVIGVLLLATVLAITHRSPDAVMDALPVSLR
jgi:hypothetical protein